MISTVAIGHEVIQARRSPRSFVLTAAVSSIGLASALALLLPTDRFAWTTPPMSLPASALGVLILVGAAVPVARVLVAPRISPAAGTGFAEWNGRRWLLAPLVLGIALWAWQADRQLPEGLWEPTVTVESDVSGVSDPTLPNDVLRLTQTRTGLRGNGERFVVRYGKDIVEAPYNARTRYLPDGRILIMLNSGLPADRQRNFLAYQFANDLIRLRFLGVEEVVAHGYAYWAANNNQNPFVVGISSGAAQRSRARPLRTCATSQERSSTHPLRACRSSLPNTGRELRRHRISCWKWSTPAKTSKMSEPASRQAAPQSFLGTSRLMSS